MSTLFDSYYDNLGNEISLGSPVMIVTCGNFIYGHVINFGKNSKDEDTFEVIPNIGYKHLNKNKEIKLKKRYNISWKNTYLINVVSRNKI